MAVVILGILSHAAVAQDPPVMDGMNEIEDTPAEEPAQEPAQEPAPPPVVVPAPPPVEATAPPPVEESAPPESTKPTNAPNIDRQIDDEDTEKPSKEPTTSPPTDAPDDDEPTKSPTIEPDTDTTKSPTTEPDTTDAPTSPTVERVPTEAPTEEPDEDTTEAPTDEPDDGDTEPPTEAPTEATEEETDSPTTSPTLETDSPTEMETDSPTEMETDSPTEMKTDRPTEMETDSPTETISSAPSKMPVRAPPIDVADDVSVNVMPLSKPMSTSNAQHFENTAEIFLSDFLIQLEQPIYNVTVNVTGETLLRRRRVRRLQESSMQVDMIVSGSFEPVDGMAETADSIGQISEMLFDAQGDKFVKMLKETDNEDDAAYFASVSSVESVSETDGGVVPPANEQPADTGGGGGLSVGIIVGIALAGALVVSLVAIFVYKKMRVPNNDRRAESNRASRQSSQKQSRQNASSARQSEATSKRLLEASGASARPAKNSLVEQVSPPVKEIGGPSGVVLRRVDSDVQSDLQSGWGAEESMLGMESNMSYAYSLEDGINATMSADYSDINIPVPSVIARTSTFGSDRNDENDFLDPSDNNFEPNAQNILREITAPPGKLGLVLTTSDRGPVVQQVAAGSPLEGMVWPGDVIVSIDGIKTKKMSADQMTQYMTTNLFKKRTLTVLSDGQA
jgi:hypothetical protein